MLKRDLFIAGTVLLMLAAAQANAEGGLRTSSGAQPTEGQLHALRSAKTASVVVFETYEGADDPTLPFEQVATALLEHAGLTVVEAEENRCDLLVAIDAQGRRLTQNYKETPPRVDSMGRQRGLTAIVCTGAELTCRVSLAGSPILENSFTVKQEQIPDEVGIEDLFPGPPLLRGRRRPESSPYLELFTAEVVPRLAATVRDVYGVGPILSSLEDKNWMVRAGAIRSLKAEPDLTAVEPLIAALKDDHPKVREWSAEALGATKDRRAVAPLIACADDRAKEVRGATMLALGMLEDPSALDVLLAALKDADEDVRVYAMMSLAHLGDSKAVLPLTDMLLDEEPSVRLQAAESLGRLKDRRAVVALIVRLMTDREPLVAAMSAVALEEISGEKFGLDSEKWQEWWQSQQRETTK